jgi:hypothetical protein
VRQYTCRQRWTVPALLDRAFFSASASEPPDRPEDTDIIPSAFQETARLLAAMLLNANHERPPRAWSIWRRRWHTAPASTTAR